jgi:hypothetical protein
MIVDEVMLRMQGTRPHHICGSHIEYLWTKTWKLDHCWGAIVLYFLVTVFLNWKRP